MTDDGRTYDVVLWGATGFTGRYVAEYLAERYGAAGLDWAVAGRDREKLEALREDLAAIDPDCESLDVLTGDALDRESLDAIAERTRVVCTTVGPYATYGSDLVAACVERGTDYCDLTGEVHWMRRTIDEHHDEARERGVRIVHACGFDSVPSDIGTLLVQEYARETFGAPCSEVRAFASSSSFGISGGTMASMVGMYEAVSETPGLRRVLADPRSLTPDGGRGGSDDRGRGGPESRRRGDEGRRGDDRRRGLPRYESDLGQWTAPFVMAVVNEKVVHRSNALLDYPWGREFHYHEVTPTGSGPSGALVATGISGGLALSTGIMSVSPLRDLVARYVLPDPGEGPSREEIEASSFEVRLLGTGADGESGEEFVVEATVAGDRDPGYGATPWMVAESAVCLATGETDSPLPGGVLTPASGIGTPLVDRLRDVGMTFEVGRRSPDGD